MMIRFKRLIACGLALAATLLVAMAFAAEVTPDMARTAMCNWRKSHGTFGMPVGKTVSEVRTVEKKGVRFHVVKMEGGGAILVPATTKKRPVIMLLEGDDFDESDENPLWDILVPDLGTAVAQPTLKTATPKAAAAPQKSIVEQQWDELLAEPLQFATGDTMSSAISDVRVDSLVKARWAQGYTETADGQWVRCYSYYTPLCPDEYEGGIRFIPSPSGCVATALGQIVRHFEHPASNVNLEPFTNTCKSNLVAVALTTVSRNFDWSKMPYDPTQFTASQLTQSGYDKAIGGLLYDLGVYLGMSYKARGSGSNTSKSPGVLLNHLGYSNASYKNGLQTDAMSETLRRIFVSNFNAKLPVQIGLSTHSIVGDGYGYNGDDVIWYHINYGWADSNTAWYQMPQYDSSGTEGLFRSAVYNIYTTRPASQVIVSGRVTKPDGTPFAGVRVSVKASAAPATEVTSATTDEKGLYAVFVEKGEYALSVSEEGAGGICVSGSTVAAATDDIGNLAFCDIETAVTSLPSNYEQLEYIESTGTQYMPLGVDCSEGTTVELTFSHMVYNQSSAIFAAGYWNWYCFIFCTQNGYFEYCSNENKLLAKADYDPEVRYTLRTSDYNSSNKQVRVAISSNGVEIASMTVDNSIKNLAAGKREISLFGMNNGGNKSQCRIYAMKIWDGNMTLQRDLVPCRNEKGEAGLWDLVEGKFYGNRGTGRFAGSDDVDVRLNWIQSDGNQYVVTDLKGEADTAVDFCFSHATYKETTAFFGEDKWDAYRFLFCMQSTKFQFWGARTDLLNASDYDADIPYRFHLGNRQVSLTPGFTTPKSVSYICNNSKDKRIAIFATSDANNKGAFRFHSMKVWASEGGVLQGDLRPYRTAAGRIGVCNMLDGSVTQFYPNLGTGEFVYGVAYNIDGTTLKLHEGTLAAEDLADYTAIEKVDWYELNAGAVTAYATPLTLAKGVFALTDGEVKKVTVGGKLTINGGVTLKIDAANGACDNFEAQSVDLAGVTEDNPIVLEITNAPGMDWSAGATLIANAGLADGPCAKVRIADNDELQPVVKNGNLTIQMKSAAAHWTGEVDDDLTNPANWEERVLPTSDTVVYFTGTAVPSITGSATFAAKRLEVDVTLADDRDWSGLAATIPVSGKIDLKGNKLTVANLPETWDAEITDSTMAYEQLEYIQSTGLEWIDTGYKPGYRTVTTMEAIPVDVSYKCAFFGCWMESGSGFSYGMYLNGNKNLAATFKGTGIGDWKSNQKPPTAGATYKMMVDGPNHKSYYWKNGALDDTLSHDAVASGSSTSSMLIFATRVNNGAASIPSKIKFLSMQITEDGTPVRDLVPVRRSDGVVGLLDLAHLGTDTEFYANKGSGTFTAGATTGYILTKSGCGEQAVPGELHVNVASGTVTGGATLTGSATLVKDGEGTFTWGRGTAAASCPILVTNGVFRMGVTTANVFGNGGTITVKENGQYDLNQNGGTSPTINRTFHIEGDGPDGSGAIINSAAGNVSGSHLSVVNLTGDATIGPGDATLGVASRIDLRGDNALVSGKGFTLTIKNGGMFCAEQKGTMKIEVERIVVTADAKFEPCGKPQQVLEVPGGIELTHGGKLMSWMSDNTDYMLAVPVTVGEGGGTIGTDRGKLKITAPVTVLAGSTATVSQTVTFGDVEVQGTLNATGTASITGTLSGGGTVSGANAKFSGDATRWTMAADAEDWTSKADLAVASTTALAALTAIDITYAGNVSKELEISPALGLTTTLPLLTVKTEDGNEIASFLTIKDDKLYVTIDLGAVVTATWTGEGEDGDIKNSKNWDCKNALGGTVAGGLPGLGTTVTFTGDKIPSILVDSDFAAKKVVLSDAILAGDCDWSGLAATIFVSGKIDLNGHNLTVSQLAGDAEITDTSATAYEQLEYIESTGTQYMPLGVDCSEGTTVELTFSHMVYKQMSAIFAAGYWNWYCFIFCTQNDYFEYCSNENKLLAKADYDPEVRYTLRTSDYNSSTKKVRAAISSNGVEIASMTVDNSIKNLTAGKREISLFGMNNGGNKSQCRIYAMKIWDGSKTLQRDLVPVRRSDGVVGLLDLAHLGTDTEFYENKGTGTFTAGAVTGFIFTRPGSAEQVAPGELHLNVAQGATVENTTVTLTGGLKLVKEGEGTLVTMDATQTYVGGTDILGGTVKLGGSSYLGPQKSPVTVYEGAVLDIGAGNHRRWTHPVLAGGTLRNSEKDVGSDQEQHSVIALTDNSSIDFTWNGGMIGSGYTATTLDLGGNTLDLKVATGKSFWFDNVDVSAGLLKFSGGGTLAIDKTSLRAASADFDIASKVTVAVPAEVHDWTVREGATVSGNGTITVNGTFRPDVDTAAKYALKGGATLDLEGRSTALNAANLTFPEGTVYIDLGERKAKSSEPLISWEEGKGPANVTFKLSPNTVTRGILEVRKDGLYIQYGMMLIVR